MAHLVIYKDMTAPYIQIVEFKTGKVWDSTNSALAAAPTYADTDIALTLNTYYNGYPITIPHALPSGKYDLLVKDNATPANTDEVVIGKRFEWAKNNVSGQPGRRERPLIDLMNL